LGNYSANRSKQLAIKIREAGWNDGETEQGCARLLRADGFLEPIAVLRHHRQDIIEDFIL
jgi:hypothetical protein